MDMTQAAEVNLRWLLQPMAALLADPAMTDLHINAPGVAFVDRGRGMERVSLPYSFGALEDGDPVAAEPKMHFRSTVLHKGLDLENGVVPEVRTDPNGTEIVFHANVPLG